MPLSKDDLTSLQSDMNAMGLEAVKAAAKVAQLVPKGTKKPPADITIQIEDEGEKKWQKYSSNLQGHPIEIAGGAARKALAAGESKEDITIMLRHDPYAQQLKPRQQRAYVRTILNSADYFQKKEPQSAAKLEQQVKAAPSMGRRR